MKTACNEPPNIVSRPRRSSTFGGMGVTCLAMSVATRAQNRHRAWRMHTAGSARAWPPLAVMVERTLRLGGPQPSRPGLLLGRHLISPPGENQTSAENAASMENNSMYSVVTRWEQRAKQLPSSTVNSCSMKLLLCSFPYDGSIPPNGRGRPMQAQRRSAPPPGQHARCSPNGVATSKHTG